MSNTFVTELIAGSQSRSALEIRSSVFEKMYLSFFDSTMSLYEDLYTGFGDTRLMVVKSTWDYAYYWGILSWLYFRAVLTDLSFLRVAQADLQQMRALNADMQSRFRSRAKDCRVDQGNGRFFDQVAIPILAQLNAELLQRSDTLENELTRNCHRLQALAPQLLRLLDGRPLTPNDSLLGDLASRFN
jgi:hypothetical protein